MNCVCVFVCVRLKPVYDGDDVDGDTPVETLSSSGVSSIVDADEHPQQKTAASSHLPLSLIMPENAGIKIRSRRELGLSQLSTVDVSG